MTNIAILGAGITGVTTAYSLLELGYDVTLYDRHNYAAMETSYANGGQLSACNAEVWNSWATVFKGMKWMLRKDAPLLFNLSPSWHKYSWIAEFLMAIRHHKSNTAQTVKLALAARKRLYEIAECESIDFDHEKRGILHFYRQRSSFEAARRTNDILSDAGLERTVLSGAGVKEVEPTLHGDFVGGFVTPGDSTGDIHKFTRGLADVCEARGAKMRLGVEITKLDHSSDGVSVTVREPDSDAEDRIQHDAIVVCAGVGSRWAASQFGDRVNVYPVKGYSITVPLKDETSQQGAPWVSLLDDDAKIVTSRLGKDRFRVAGTAEFNGVNRDIRACRITPLVQWVERYFPNVETSGTIPWAGLRPMMPDMMPRVRQGRSDRVFYNTGHGHLGWTLSAATADMVAELVAGRFQRVHSGVTVFPGVQSRKAKLKSQETEVA